MFSTLSTTAQTAEGENFGAGSKLLRSKQAVKFQHLHSEDLERSKATAYKSYILSEN